MNLGTKTKNQIGFYIKHRVPRGDMTDSRGRKDSPYRGSESDAADWIEPPYATFLVENLIELYRELAAWDDMASDMP